MAEFATFEDHWPLVIIVAPAHTSAESMAYFCERHDERFKRRERFVTINDMTKMRGMLDARTRKIVADWTKARDADIGRWIVGSANVVENPLLRGIITAVHWVAKPPNPLLVTSTHAEALEFVKGRLREEGVPVSLRLAEYLRGRAAS